MTDEEAAATAAPRFSRSSTIRASNADQTNDDQQQHDPTFGIWATTTDDPATTVLKRGLPAAATRQAVANDQPPPSVHPSSPINLVEGESDNDTPSHPRPNVPPTTMNHASHPQPDGPPTMNHVQPPVMNHIKPGMTHVFPVSYQPNPNPNNNRIPNPPQQQWQGQPTMTEIDVRALLNESRDNWAQQEERRLRIQGDMQLQISRSQMESHERMLEKLMQMERERDERRLAIEKEHIHSIQAIMNAVIGMSKRD